MLVEINLLPQKELKKLAFIFILAGMLALLLIAGGIYFYKINTTKSDIENVARQIDMTQKIVAKAQQNGQTADASSSVSQLKGAIAWASAYPIQTIPVMNHLSSLLPARGFIQSLAYTDAGTVNLTVQFDSERDAAYFLDNLNQSKWITDVSLKSLAASQQTNPAAAGASTTNSPASTTTGSAGASSSQATGSNAVNSGSQTTGTQATATAQNSTTNAAAATTSSTAATTSAAASSDTSSNTGTSSSNFLPRYIGQFQIKLNMDVIQQSLHNGKTNGKGVAGS